MTGHRSQRQGKCNGKGQGSRDCRPSQPSYSMFDVRIFGCFLKRLKREEREGSHRSQRQGQEQGRGYIYDRWTREGGIYMTDGQGRGVYI